MTFKFSHNSRNKLATCQHDLRRLFNEVIKHVDCTIIEGLRSEERQIELFRVKKTKTLKSKHLLQKDRTSHAVDVMAYPIDWKDWKRNAMFVGFVRGIASQMGIKIKSGIDWDGDFDIKEHSFLDAPHFELVGGSDEDS